MLITAYVASTARAQPKPPCRLLSALQLPEANTGTARQPSVAADRSVVCAFELAGRFLRLLH